MQNNKALFDLPMQAKWRQFLPYWSVSFKSRPLSNKKFLKKYYNNLP